MKPWIDPRERRARWYFSALAVACGAGLIAALYLLVYEDLTSEETVILLVASAIGIVTVFFAIRKVRQLPREFQQYEESNETSSDPG